MREEYDFSKGKRGAVVPPEAGKVRITIRFDADIIEHFKAQAHTAGGNYQTLINQVLREHIERNQPLEQILRRIVREELQRSKQVS